MNENNLIDRLWQIHNARKGLIGLLQACENAADASMLVQLHHIGGIMEILDNEEEKVFNLLQNPPAKVA